MATLASLSAKVVELTRRPEIPGITAAAIKSAILRAHHTDFFPRDLSSAVLSYSLPVSTPLFQDFANISALLPALRNFQAVMSIDSVTQVPVEKLEYRDLDDLYMTDGTQRTSVYSLLGDTLRCYFLAWTGALNVIYYRNPTFTETEAVSWIADTYPDEIASWAAGIVFARTGFMEQAQASQELHVKPFKESLIASHLLGEVN